MQLIEEWMCFGGQQQVWQHHSDTLACDMRFAVYLPPQATEKPCPVLYFLSGLTCTERNMIEKSGFQRYAADHGLIIITPDTSPRGEDVADDESYDLGQGAGFYLNATQSPWAAHYQMYDYIVDELPALVHEQFPTNKQESIFGHSMGGHGALLIGLRNPKRYQSISAFSPIVAPSQVYWGRKAFSAYLGDDEKTWKEWDSLELLKQAEQLPPIRIEQGLDDEFLEHQLRPHLFAEIAKEKRMDFKLNYRAGYDHSYYFIASFIGEHIAFHADELTN